MFALPAQGDARDAQLANLVSAEVRRQGGGEEPNGAVHPFAESACRRAGHLDRPERSPRATRLRCVLIYYVSSPVLLPPDSSGRSNDSSCRSKRQ